MLRTLALLAMASLTLMVPAKADCPTDCSIAYAGCYATWNLWGAWCASATQSRYDAATFNCNYDCFDPCDPDLCQAVADANYDDETATCDGVVWDALDGCDNDYAECLIGCVG
jgi:hypothetical protein